jgi:PPM family protein phosphatase
MISAMSGELRLEHPLENMDNTLHVQSDVGRMREQNEDCGVALDLRIAADQARSVLLLAVADGMGGREAGEVASRMAVQSVIYAVNSRATASDGTGFDAASALDEGFRLANKAIVEAANDDPKLHGMGTTMTAVVLCENTLTLGHVGDTRAYVIGRRGVARLSRDHSVVQEKLDSGVLTAEQARTSSERNQLTRALGVNESVTCDILTEPVLPGDCILLCTDGLHNSIGDAELASAVAAHEEARDVCGSLVSRALQLDGSDNITVICKKVIVPSGRQRVAVERRVETRSMRQPLLFALLGLVLLGICFLTYMALVPRGTAKGGPGPGTARHQVSQHRLVAVPEHTLVNKRHRHRSAHKRQRDAGDNR